MKYLLVLLLLAACAPNEPRPPIYIEGLDQYPEYKRKAEELVIAGTGGGAVHWRGGKRRYYHIFVTPGPYLMKHPITLPVGWGGLNTPYTFWLAESFVDGENGVIAFSWHLAPDGKFEVTNIPYEMRNVEFNCEAAYLGYDYNGNKTNSPIAKGN